MDVTQTHRKDTVYVCGDNSRGQLGLGDTNNRNTLTHLDLSDLTGQHGELVDVSLGWGHSVFKFSDGRVYVCGNNACS